MTGKGFSPAPPQTVFAGLKIEPLAAVDPNVADRGLSLRELLDKAVALHSDGKLSDAERVYGLVLEKDPQDANALTNLGTILMQRGDLEAGIARVEASLAIRPNQANALNNLGNALNILGRHTQAEDACRRSIALQPGNFDAFNNLGNALREQGLIDEAGAAYDQAFALNPAFLPALDNKAIMLIAKQRPQEALEVLDRVIDLHPDYVDGPNLRGNALQALKRFDEALEAYEAALKIDPNSGEVLTNKAVALQNLKRLDEARVIVEQAISVRPDYVEAYFNGGNILNALKQYEAALGYFRHAVALKPDYAEAHVNLGVSLHEMKRHAEAYDALQHALTLKPDLDTAYGCLGNVLQATDRREESLAMQERAIALNPANLDHYNNRALVLMDLGRFDEALADLDHIRAVKPDHVEANWNKAIACILLERYEEGWSLYEWRWRKPDFAYETIQPTPFRWLADMDLTGKTVMIQAEQGLGDSLQMLSYAPLLAAKGARVVAGIQAPLGEIAATADGVNLVAVPGDPIPAYDIRIMAMSLPLAMGTTLETVPGRSAYVHVTPEARKKWADLLVTRTRPRIGLAWSGSRVHINDANRSLPLEQLKPLLELDAEFVALQVEYRDGDLQWLEQDGRVRSFHGEINSFMDTAGLMEQMDLVISVDTSVAHLAGALGRPLWLLIPKTPDYRWHLGRETTPWYPSARLFRQTGLKDWPGLMARVKDEAAQFIAAAG